MRSGSILLISSGQPSLNPRLVKEADTLTDAGFNVIVLYAYWNEWGARHDEQLLAGKKWRGICVGGDPIHDKTTWFFSRMLFKLNRYSLSHTTFYKQLADIAVARSSYFLIKAAKKYKAILYIAHNLGALPAAAKAAALYNKPYGFDAEDFHRQETTDDDSSFNYKISKYIEDKYLPTANYITASSPLIAKQYALLYNRQVITLLNVFPKTSIVPITEERNHPLKLFWFSQTIGPNRGLETIIEAFGISNCVGELHLLGQPVNGYSQHLTSIAGAAGVDKTRIFFYPPVKADEIFIMAAQFDIGLASETGFCLNNSIALSNKIFTYIQSGLAVAVSDTPAQREWLNLYPDVGKLYRTAKELAVILDNYHINREALYKTRVEASKIGQTELNWETEGIKFLNVVGNALVKQAE